MNDFHRTISLPQGIGLMMTVLLGTGVFAVPALAATAAGSGSLWAWVAMIVLILPIAMCFGQLGARFPHAGGAAHFIGRGFGAVAERSMGWVFLSVLPIGGAAAFVIATGYLGQLVGLSAQTVGLSLCVWLLLLALSLSGASWASRVQTLIAIVVVVTILLPLPATEVTVQSFVTPLETLPEWSSFTAAIGIIVWCFLGVEAVAHLGAEFKCPERDFPITLVLSTGIVGLLFIICALVVLDQGAYGNDATDSASLAIVFQSQFGDWGRRGVAAVAFLACLATINVYMMSFARMVWSLADQGALPEGLSRLNPRGVPVYATWAVFIILAISLLLSRFSGLDLEHLILYTDGIFVLIYLGVSVVGLRLLSGVGWWVSLISLFACMALVIMFGTALTYGCIILVLAYGWEWYRLNRRSSYDVTPH